MDLLKDIYCCIGWDFLLNEYCILEVNGVKVVVIGVENYLIYLCFFKYGDLKQAVEGFGMVDFKLLLLYDFLYWEGEVMNDYQDIVIIFFGYIYGMQFGVEIFGWIKWSFIKYVYK